MKCLACFLVAGVIATIAPLGGCTNPPAARASARLGQKLDVFVDVSGSTEQIRKPLIATTYQVFCDNAAEIDSCRIYKFGSSVEECSDGKPASEQSLIAELSADLTASDRIKGTDYARVAEQMANEAKSTQEATTFLVVGDGGNDRNDPESLRDYARAGNELGKCKNVMRVVFWPVDPSSRKQLRECYNALGDRLVLLGREQDPAQYLES